MKVYILEHRYYYDDTSILGIFSSREKANEALQKASGKKGQINKNNNTLSAYDNNQCWEIVIWEVDGPPFLE